MNGVQGFVQAFLGGDVSPLFLIVVFGACFLFVLAATFLLGPEDSVERRLLAEPGKGGRGRGSRSKASLRGDKDTTYLARLTRRFQGLSSSEEWKASRLKRRLVQAGYMGQDAVGKYYLARIGLAIILSVGFTLMIPFISRTAEVQHIFMLAITLGATGYFLPAIWIRARISSRQTAARDGFPDAMDMLLVCVESGLSLDAALNRVAEEIHTAHPLLSEQLGLVTLELRAGQRRNVALRNLADRLGIQEASSLVTLLVQSEKLGSSISQTLRVHADEIREKRMSRAEEKANILPVKLSIPLALFLFPAFFVAILTPAIINIIRILLPTLGQT